MRGRTRGFEVFLIWWHGEALRELLPRLKEGRARVAGRTGKTGPPNRDTDRSCVGDSSKISDRDREEADCGRAVFVAKRNKGAWLSAAECCGTAAALNALPFDNDGLKGPDLLRSCGMCKDRTSVEGESEEGGVGIEVIDTSVGVLSGEGDCSWTSSVLPKAGLCGSGDNSMLSQWIPGDDVWIGGVVAATFVSARAREVIGTQVPL